jgi:hypothetical protein
MTFETRPSSGGLAVGTPVDWFIELDNADKDAREGGGTVAILSEDADELRHRRRRSRLDHSRQAEIPANRATTPEAFSVASEIVTGTGRVGGSSIPGPMANPVG